MPDVMISYSRRDAAFVRRLHDALQEHGQDVWVDWQDIPLSADWWQEIATAVEQADTFVFVISPDSMSSPICNLEIDHARDHGKRLIPILHRETDLDDALTSIQDKPLADNTRKVLGDRTMEQVLRENWNAVARHNWIYFVDDGDFDQSLERLLTAMQTDLEHLRQHTRLLTRAVEWQQRGRNKDLLLTGQALDEAENWLSSSIDKDPRPTPLHAEYIADSRDEAQRRSRALLTMVTVALVISLLLAVLAGFLAFYANGQRALANDNAQIADEQREIALSNAYEAQSLLWANNALALQNGDTPLAITLALEAVRVPNPPPLAKRTLAEVAFAAGPIRRIATDIENGSAAVNAVAISPDGRFVATGLSDSNVFVWALESGEITLFFGDHRLPVTALAYLPDGSAILSAASNELYLFSTEGGAILRQLRHPGGVIVNAVAVSPDGTQALSGAGDGSLVLWDLETGGTIGQIEAHSDAVTAVAFSNDGRLAFSASVDDTVQVWNLADGTLIQTLRVPGDDLLALTVNPNTTEIIVGLRLGGLIRWNYVTTETMAFGTVSLYTHSGAVNSVAYNPSGSWVISGGEDQRVIVWDVATGAAIQLFETHQGAVNGVAFSPDGRTALSGGDDNFVYWWNTVPSEVDRVLAQNRLRDELKDNILSTAYDPTGNFLLATDLYTHLVLYNTNTGRTQRIYQEGPRASAHTDAINTIAFNPDGTRFVTGGDDNRLLVWDTASGQILARYEGHTSGVSVATFSPDGTQVLSGDQDGVVHLWDANTGALIYALSKDETTTHRGEVRSLAFSPNGNVAISGARSVFAWDLSNGTLLAEYTGHTRRVIALAYSDDFTKVYSASDDDTLIVWDVINHQMIASYNLAIDSGERSVNAVAFHPDTQRALIGRTTGAFEVWDLVEGRILASFTVPDAASARQIITTVSFAPDGQLAAVGTRDGTLLTVRTFTLDRLIEWTEQNRFIRELSCQERDTFNIAPLCEVQQAVLVDAAAVLQPTSTP